MVLFPVVFTAIGPHEEFEVVKVPIELPSSYKVTRVPATAVPPRVPETDVALSATEAGRVPHLAELVAAAVLNVAEFVLTPQLPF